MNRSSFVLFISVFSFFLAFCFISHANDTVNFTISVSVPPASGVSITAYEIPIAASTSKTTLKTLSGSDDSGSPLETINFGDPVKELAFGTLGYDKDLNIWASEKYFAINVEPTDGAGSVDTTISYTDGYIPEGQTKGLGYKGAVNFVSVNSDNQETSIKKRVFKELIGGEVTTQQDVGNGMLRLYVYLISDLTTWAKERGGEPFTSADKPGTYTGTLTISATMY